MATAISFQGKITFPIFMAAQLLHLGWKKYLLILVPLLVILGSIFSSPNPASSDALIPALGGVIVVPVLFYWIRSKWKKIYSDTPYFQYPISGEIAGEGFTASNQRGTSNIPWGDITSFKFNTKVMIIYQGPLVFHVLAPDFFSSSQDWDSAKQMIAMSLNRPS